MVRNGDIDVDLVLLLWRWIVSKNGSWTLGFDCGILLWILVVDELIDYVSDVKGIIWKK